MSVTLDAGTTRAPYELLRILDQAILEPTKRLKAIYEGSGEDRRALRESLRASGEEDLLTSLRLRESVADLLLGSVERAFGSAHDVWLAVNGRASGTIQALVLTQLAACREARGDQRGALRAARQAEVLLLAEAGEDTPQVLAVRSQLVHLLRQVGQECPQAEERTRRTMRALEHRAGCDQSALERLAQWRAWFMGDGSPPHWALLYLRRWKKPLAGEDAALEHS